MSPLAWIKIGLIVAAIVAAFAVVNRIEQAGADRERVRTEIGNKVSGSKADAAERDVLSCPAGKWNKETSTCEK